MSNSKRPSGLTCSPTWNTTARCFSSRSSYFEWADAYFDGILGVALGEKPERLLSILTDQIELLTGARAGLETINAAEESRWTITCS